MALITNPLRAYRNARKAFRAFNDARKSMKGNRDLRRRLKQAAQTSELLDIIEPTPTEEPPMANEIFLLLLRHGLTTVGGAGLLADSDVVQLAAALSTLAGLGWSAWRKHKRSRTADT